MELTCRLSPFAFAAFYDRLFSLNWHSAKERAESLGIDSDWATEASRRYLSIGEFASRSGDPTESGFDTVDERHAQLASWILAAERVGSRIPTGEIEFEMAQWMTNRRLRVEVEDRGVVVGWILGRSLAPMVWPRLPAIPAFFPLDPDLSAAFTGFMEHARFISGPPEGWTEMMRTSVTWRVGGLVDGLIPRDTDGTSTETRFRRLIVSLGGDLSVTEKSLCDRATRDFDEERNVLTHVIELRGENFRKVADSFTGVDALYPRAAAGSLIVFDQVGSEQVEEDSPRGLLEAVDSELESWRWAE